ncbi:hypothetical protein PACTADRAFT_50987 [Pachysolen tannophilus NRRL Y-2460]|uniref:VPS10 domain-containing protein n=1 Tax=Pachysolen tannophilus NRRL Y-2460 TaxID=669874 RepID=A0A1E4TQV8_PACTA|nr:hypothetical protein PACTADRAFT_50987 [Pachysolen tannophilus NRRL Y-2460]
MRLIDGINFVLLNFLILWAGIVFSIDEFVPQVITSAVRDTISDTLLYFDDSMNVLNLNNYVLTISQNDGKSWKQINLGNGEYIFSIISDSVDRKRAFAFTNSTNHFITRDAGITWQPLKFNTLITSPDLQTNFANPNLVLFNIFYCNESSEDYLLTGCKTSFYYTNDGFKTDVKKLEAENLIDCTFAKANEFFTAGDDSRLICTTQQKDSFDFVKDTSLIATSDWFKTIEQMNDESGTLATSSIMELKVVGSFLVAVTQTDRYNSNSHVEFYVSKDGLTFNKAEFEVDLGILIYKIVSSGSDSLLVAAWHALNSKDMYPVAVLFRSDSSGLYFSRELTDMFGSIAMDKVQNVDGAWLTDVVVGRANNGYPNLKSKISIDDGLTWDYLKVVNNSLSCSNDDECSFHLMTDTVRDGEGNFVTGPTPGIVMGIGSVGKYAAPFNELEKLHTYVSRDGGLTWKYALEEQTAYAFGDQGNIILAFPYYHFAKGKNGKSTEFTSSSLYYSLDQGETWRSYELDRKIFPLMITTTIDGTSTKFILVGLYENMSKEVVYSIDFSGAFTSKCKQSDFEDWNARVNTTTNQQTCILGHKQKFPRRKQFAKCFVDTLFEDVKVIEESCECTESDYECTVGFIKDSTGICQPNLKIIGQNYCLGKNKNKKLKLNRKQKIPNTLCKGDFKLAKDEVEVDCKEAVEEQSIITTQKSFEGSIAQYYYLKPSHNSSFIDETLLLRTTENIIYYSYNGGQTFYRFDSLESYDDDFAFIYLNPYFPDQVYLITSTSKIYISDDRGINFRVTKAPSDINEFGLKVLTFNKKDPNKFIWYGEKNCDNFFSNDCKVQTYYTEDGGATFSPLLENVRSCYYVGSVFNDKLYDFNENLIYCEQKTGGQNYLTLVSSTDNFKTNKVTVYDKIVGIAVTGEFAVVASIKLDEKSLEAHVTVDGNNFADALFPANFHVEKQQAYTVIDSSTKALFIHVTTSSQRDHEFGSILKSNSNGTSYVLSIDNVNRNTYGFADYEKVQGLEGVSLINVVNNANEVQNSQAAKQLKSMITHNDGSEWNFITPPSTDSQGKKFSCKGSSLKKCSLNLHGFTERVDSRDTYSSGSAIGMLIGVGNVGEYLTSFDDPSTGTFLTRDGGITWKEIKKGNYMWEYGDQGTILVLAKNSGTTSTISYSLDEGDTWNDYQFVDEEITVLDLATVPSDTARRFLIFGRTKNNVLTSYSIDFTHVHQRQCKLDFDNPSKDDFEYWSPRHPYLPDNCLFGHESKYLRRISSHSDCFIGSAPLNIAYKEIRNCSCTTRDFECDYNYARADDGTCKLVSGLTPPDHSAVCAKDDSLLEYWEPTGYRKIPLSTCKGGKQLDKWISHPCPGKESQFKDKYSIKGFALALTIIIPIAVFIFATWFVYDRGIRRNGGFSRFGQIRLDEDEFQPIENNRTDKIVNKIVKGFIFAIGGVIAFNGLVKSRLRELFGRSSRYASLHSFGNGDLDDDVLDDDSLFNFNDVDDDDDAREIDSFIEQDDDQLNVVASGGEQQADGNNDNIGKNNNNNAENNVTDAPEFLLDDDEEENDISNQNDDIQK